MRRILIILYLLFLINPLSAEIIKKIDISGNDRLSERLLKYMEIFQSIKM